MVGAAQDRHHALLRAHKTTVCEDVAAQGQEQNRLVTALEPVGPERDEAIDDGKHVGPPVFTPRRRRCHMNRVVVILRQGARELDEVLAGEGEQLMHGEPARIEALCKILQRGQLSRPRVPDDRVDQRLEPRLVANGRDPPTLTRAWVEV